MPIRYVPNEVANKGFMLATETTPGTYVTPTKRMMTAFSATPGIGALKRSQDATGGYDRTATIRRDFADPSGTIGGGATYQELAILSQYAIKGGVTGTSDANPNVATTYTFAPTFNADDISTFSALFGVDGLPWEATGVRLGEFNISGDATSADDQWQLGGTPFLQDAKRYEGFEGVATGGTTGTVVMTGAGWTVNEHQGAYVFLDYGSGNGEVRQVASNTADTLTLETAASSAVVAGDVFYISGLFPSLALPNYDVITMEGTKIYLDVYNASASTLGTTEISDRMLSFNVSQTLNLSNKRRASGIIARKGRGAREVTGTLRFEYDRWDEYKKWIGDSELSIRIEKTGPAINASPLTNHRARIDIERAVFDTWTEDADNNNMTVSLAFVALQESPTWAVNVVTDIATLP